jgi:hypothetical protein
MAKPIYLYSPREKGWAVVNDLTRKRLSPRTFDSPDEAQEWARENVAKPEDRARPVGQP